MSEIKEHLEAFTRLGHPLPPLWKFMLDHGRTWTVNQDTFAGPRGEPQQCYMNSTHLAFDRRDLTYVEGKVSVCGLPVDHAWCVDAAGNVIDLTLDLPIDGGDSMERVREYFGVPFRTDYVMRATLVNRVYGLLDGFHARRTLPKLVELGLDAGQDWLLAQKLRRGGRLAVPRQKRAKSVRAMALAALVLLPHDLQAQTRAPSAETVYGADGGVRARIAPGSGGATTVYGADGRVEARTTRGSDGTVTVYGPDGRVIERVTGAKK